MDFFIKRMFYLKRDVICNFAFLTQIKRNSYQAQLASGE